MPESTINQKKSLFAAALAHICQDGLGAATYVLLPILADVFGLSYAQVGAIKGVKNLAMGLLELVSGFLSERFSESRILVLGLLMSGVGFAALSTTSTVALVISCLLLVGLGGGLQHAPASALVSSTYCNHNRRSALGLYNSAGDVGKLLFSACFSVAIAAGVAWQQVVLSYGAMALLAAMVIGVIIAVHKPWVAANAGEKTTGTGSESARGWGVLNVSHFSILLTVIFIDNVVQACALVFVAFLMIANELPLYVATFSTAMVLVGGVLGKAGCGYLAEKVGVRRAFVLVQLLTAIGLISIVVAPVWLAFALLLPLGIVSQGSTSITYGLLPDYIHHERMARGYALLYSSTSIAAAAGPWLIGLVADVYGIDIAFNLLAALSLLALVPLILSTGFGNTALNAGNILS